jgi:hypothetical protein
MRRCLSVLTMILVSVASVRAEVRLKQIAPHPGVSFGALLSGDNLLVTEGGYGKIQIIPLPHPENRRELATGKYPFQFLQVGKYILVANTQDEQLTVLNQKLAIYKQIKVPLGIAGMALRDRDILGVMAADNGILPISRTWLRPGKPVDAGHGPWRLAVSGDRILVIQHRNIMDPSYDALLILDNQFKPLKLIPTGGGLREVGTGPDGLFYVTQKLTGKTLVVDGQRLDIVKTYDTGENPGGVTFLKNLVLVVSQADHTLTVIDQAAGGKVYTTDLNRFGFAINNPLTVVAGPNGTLYFVSEGAVTELTGFLTSNGGNWSVSAEALGGSTPVPPPQAQSREMVRQLAGDWFLSEGGVLAKLARQLLSDIR